MSENADMRTRPRGFIRLCGFLLAGSCLLAQSKRPEDLATGKILVTIKRSADPLFAQSVVLLVRHDQNGALGLMLNHRSTLPISRALKELDGAAAHSEPVFAGGPVDLETVFALRRTAQKPQDATPVFGNIYMLTGRPALEKALHGNSTPAELRIYIGYCGWGPGQLEREVRVGVWYIFDRSEDLTFDAQPATLWSRLIDEAEGLKAQLMEHGR